MTVYSPSAGFAFTLSYIKRVDFYCSPLYTVTVLGLGEYRFFNPSNPTRVDYLSVPRLQQPEFNSNHYTLDGLISRAWYVIGGVEHVWNDWGVYFSYDPALLGYRVKLAVYSFDQHFYGRVMPTAPSTYWRPLS